jgi:hypothetical protein
MHAFCHRGRAAHAVVAVEGDIADRARDQISVNAASDGYLCYLWGKRPEIAGDVVYRVPRCLAACQPVSPIRPGMPHWYLTLVTFPVMQKALSLFEKGPLALVAGEGFEPSTSGL